MMSRLLVVLVCVWCAVGAVATTGHVADTVAAFAAASAREDNMMCVKPVELGGDCTGSDECLLYAECVGGKCQVMETDVECGQQEDCGRYMACVEGKCRVLKVHGDACEDNAECITQNCVAQQCTGIALGGACDHTAAFNPCDGGFCVDRKCEASLKEGDSCGMRIAQLSQLQASQAMLQDVCEPGTSCTGANIDDFVTHAKCMRSFSITEGGKCYPVGATGCKLNLVCQADGTSATCVNKTGDACTRASAATECGLASACLCNADGEGKCVLASNVGLRAMGALETYVMCAADHSCPNSMLANALGAEQEGSCLNVHCAEQREEAECTARFGYAETYHSHYGCGGRTGDDERSYIEDWGIALIAIGGFCLLALILGGWLRNRRLHTAAISQDRLLD